MAEESILRVLEVPLCGNTVGELLQPADRLRFRWALLPCARARPALQAAGNCWKDGELVASALRLAQPALRRAMQVDMGSSWQAMQHLLELVLSTDARAWAASWCTTKWALHLNETTDTGYDRTHSTRVAAMALLASAGAHPARLPVAQRLWRVYGAYMWPWALTMLAAAAARCGNVPLLQWVEELQASGAGRCEVHIGANAALTGPPLRLSGAPALAFLAALEGARAGRRDLVEWGTSRFPTLLSAHMMTAAAAGGQPDVLRWLCEQRVPWDAAACAAAAEHGRLGALMYLREAGCPWDWRTTWRAAAGGQECTLRWAREQGCPWHAFAAVELAARGDLPLLRWAVQDGCPLPASVYRAAAEHGHADVLAWLRTALPLEVNPHLAVGLLARGDDASYAEFQGMVSERLAVAIDHAELESLVANAARTGRVQALERLAREGVGIDERLWSTARHNASIEALQWLHEAGRALDDRAFVRFAAEGNLRALQWMHARGLPLSAALCTAAAEHGQMETVQWLLEHGCAHDADMVHSTRRSGFGVLQEWWQRREGADGVGGVWGVGGVVYA